MARAIAKLAPSEIEKIDDYRFHALGTKGIHSRRLTKLKKMIGAVDALGVIVPTLYAVVLTWTHNTRYAEPAQFLWDVFLALLGVGTLLKMANRWQEKAQRHSELRDRNISIANRAEKILSRAGELDAEGYEVRSFLEEAEALEKADHEALGTPSDAERQYGYRISMKESNGDCAICGASPHRYSAGECQACGGTPVIQLRSSAPPALPEARE